MREYLWSLLAPAGGFAAAFRGTRLQRDPALLGMMPASTGMLRSIRDRVVSVRFGGRLPPGSMGVASLDRRVEDPARFLLNRAEIRALLEFSKAGGSWILPVSHRMGLPAQRPEPPVPESVQPEPEVIDVGPAPLLPVRAPNIVRLEVRERAFPLSRIRLLNQVRVYRRILEGHRSIPAYRPVVRGGS